MASRWPAIRAPRWTPLVQPARDAGFALPIVVFALVLLGMIGGAALQSSRDELFSAEAVSHSNQAFYAAEAGIHSAASNWDQVAMDTLMASPGDSLLGSWTSIENRCSYQLVYRRIDGGDRPDKLYSVESTGRKPWPQRGKAPDRHHHEGRVRARCRPRLWR